MAEIKKIQPMGSSTQYDLDALHVLYDGGRIASPSAMNADNRLHIYLSTSSMTTDKPPSGDGHILHFGWDNQAGWSNQLAIGNTGHLAVRGGNGSGDGTANTQDWKSWYTVLDSNNYNNYAPTKTGGGASGTWGISISGNAATATALTSNAGSSSVPIYFSGGKPVQCSTTLGVSITGSSASCTGNAATSSSCSGHSRDALAVRELQSNNINIQTWVNTQANIHTTGDQGEMQVRRFFASDGSAPSTYALPEVDSHNLIFSIDNGTSWNRILNLDMRTNDIYTTGKYSGVWQNWSKLLTLHYVTTASDFNSYTTTGIYVIRSGGNTNYATTEGNHGVLFVMWDIGTPFQVFLGDSSINYFRKRYYSGGAWSAWFTMGAAWS